MMFWYILIASIFGGLRPENHLAERPPRKTCSCARKSAWNPLRMSSRWCSLAIEEIAIWYQLQPCFMYTYIYIYRLIIFDSQMTQITIWLFIRHAATGEVRGGFKTWRLPSQKRKPREDGMRFRTGLQGFDGQRVAQKNGWKSKDIAMTSPNKMGVC